MKKELIVLSLVATAGLYFGIRAWGGADSSEASESTSVAVPSQTISQDDFIRAAEQTVNGVVSVKSYATPNMRQSQGGYSSGDPLFDFFFGSPRRQAPRQQQTPSQQQIGLGSGVIISEDGYIVTNNHVIADAERLEVTLNDNRNFDATVVGTDPDTDLALIKIEAPALHVIPMGKSEDLHVGEWVLAVGNPFGFTSTVTSGIVSAKARNISRSTGAPSRGGIEAYIQTDAALNSGNSGGALVNLRGQLVGINTAIYSQTGTYAGCSFAIPTSIVEKVVGDIKSFGAVQRAYLGIMFQELTPELVKEKQLKGTPSGIYVAKVEDRTAAREAGLEPGDIIVSVGGKPTLSMAQMQEAITSFSPGDKVEIEYWRDGRKQSTTATLRNNRGETGITVHRGDADALGAKLTEVDDDTLRRLGMSHGVAVADVDSDGLFGSAGIRSGFIILSINNRRVSSPDDVKTLYRAVAKSDISQDKVLFISGIYPSGKSAFYAVPVE